MARVLIREAHGGATREIDDRALPYFPGWVILDTLDDSTDASPLYLSKAESDFRYVRPGDLTSPDSAIGLALKAAAGHGVSVQQAGAKGDGVADDTAAINAAITTARTQGNNVVFFPAGTYKVTAPLDTYSHMTYIGAGLGLSILKCVSAGSFRCFSDAEGATQANPMTDTVFADMTIDGSAVQGSVSKAFFVQYMLRARWLNVRATGWPATGFGADFLQDSIFAYCVADGNGRLLNVGDAGASGFGIGTGAYAVESVTLIGCRAHANKNYGIFFEQQNVANGGNPYLSKGQRIIGCHSTGNNWGIGDGGVDGLVVEGCTLSNNTQDGLSVDQGTAGGIGRPGFNGLVTGNIIRSNGRYGIFLDYRFKATNTADSRYTIRGNRISENTVGGVQVSTDTISIQNITVADNDLTANGACGITAAVLSSGSLVDLSILNNRIDRNGKTNAGGYTQGIRIDGATTRLRVRGNACYDSAATKTQTYGLQLSAYTATDPVVTENDFRGNVNSGGLFNQSTLAGLPVIRNNRGHNPKGALTAPGVPASGGSYTNVTGYDCTVYVAGGTVTSIAVGAGGASPTGVTSGAVRVPAGQSIYLTYSAAPTWTWFAD